MTGAEQPVAGPTGPLLPRPPFRMFSFAYNATAGGPDCKRSDSRHHNYYCDNKTTATAIPADVLYPSHTYNLLNPAECYNTTAPLTDWLNKRGVACMAWEACWNKKFPKHTNDSVRVLHLKPAFVTGAW